MMIGMGTPKSHKRIPRPKPMTASFARIQSPEANFARFKQFPHATRDAGSQNGTGLRSLRLYASLTRGQALLSPRVRTDAGRQSKGAAHDGTRILWTDAHLLGHDLSRRGGGGGRGRHGRDRSRPRSLSESDRLHDGMRADADDLPAGCAADAG